MIDPTSCDWAGDNTTKGKAKSDWRFIWVVALFVLGFALSTMIIWSI